MGARDKKAIADLRVLCSNCCFVGNCDYYCSEATIILEKHKLFFPHPIKSDGKQQKEQFKESYNSTKLIPELLTSPETKLNS